MELISKIDIEGTLEINDSLRQIGVATSNLTPDANGEIALSKQNAMIMETPSNAIQTGIISETPIQTGSTNQLNEIESLNFSGVAPQAIQTTQAQTTEAAQTTEQPQSVELPPMEDVTAVASDTVPAGLFIDDPNGNIKLENPLQGETQVVAADNVQEQSQQAGTVIDMNSAPQEGSMVKMPASAIQETQAEPQPEASIFEKPATEGVDLSTSTNEALNFVSEDEMEIYINNLFDQFETKHNEELNRFKENIISTCKFLFNNKAQQLTTSTAPTQVETVNISNNFVNPVEPVGNVNKVEEVLSTIPSLDSQMEIPQQSSGMAETAPTFEFQNVNELNSIDTEEIKPKFVSF